MQNMTTKFTTLAKFFIAVIVSLTALSLSTSAQDVTAKSRVAVVASETKTKIWVSSFPKKANIVIMDSENNMLSMTTTNDYGAAYITLPAGVSTSVIVKTLDGTIEVSNKSAVKTSHEESIASTDDDDETIA